MANDIQEQPSIETLSISIGERFKAAREELGQSRKDIAAQLRLNESVIAMMEENRLPADLPITFVRGYIRAYGKLLCIPEAETLAAIEPIKQATQPIEPLMTAKSNIPVTSSNYFMQFSTYIIVLTITGLAGGWWYSHNNAAPAPSIAENLPLNTQQKALPLPAMPDIASQDTAQPLNPVQNQAQDQTEPLAPALGVAVAQTTSPITNQSQANKEAPAASEPKKVQAAQKPAYMRHHDDDDDDDA